MLKKTGDNTQESAPQKKSRDWGASVLLLATTILTFCTYDLDSSS